MRCPSPVTRRALIKFRTLRAVGGHKTTDLSGCDCPLLALSGHAHHACRMPAFGCKADMATALSEVHQHTALGAVKKAIFDGSIAAPRKEPALDANGGLRPAARPEEVRSYEDLHFQV